MDHDDYDLVRRKKLMVLLLLLEGYRRIMNIIYDDAQCSSYGKGEELMACHLIISELSSIILEKIVPCRVLNYVERTVPGQTAMQFRQHFRLTTGMYIKEYTFLRTYSSFCILKISIACEHNYVVCNSCILPTY